MSTQQAIPFEILHLNDEGYHLKIVASINDVQLSLILDTGASQTAFDTDYIRDHFDELSITPGEQISAGLGTNTMESFECIVDTFKMGNLTLRNYKAALLDLSHVNSAYKKLNINPIQGVLGNDILLKYEALIDYKNKQVWLSKYEL
jgi:predicted aspartyl protease